MKFGIGQPMRRHEDLRLITGRGCYTDDVILKNGMLEPDMDFIEKPFSSESLTRRVREVLDAPERRKPGDGGGGSAEGQGAGGK